MFGDLRYFHNTGTASAPAFAAAALNPFGLTNVGTFSVPTLVDIDADGDLDLFVGINTGDTYFFANTGTPMAPAFAAALLNPFGLSSVGLTAAPTFVDIYGDGSLDAFIGSGDGSVYFFANHGSATAPAFGPPQVDPFGLGHQIGSHAKPVFADIDDDGYRDTFLGNFAGYLFYFANGRRVAPAPALPPWGLAAGLAALAGVAFTTLRRR